MYMSIELRLSSVTQHCTVLIHPHTVPGAPPQLVKAYAESSTSIRIVWQPPPENKRNGRITYYKVGLALAVMDGDFDAA